MKRVTAQQHKEMNRIWERKLHEWMVNLGYTPGTFTVRATKMGYHHPDVKEVRPKPRPEPKQKPEPETPKKSYPKKWQEYQQTPKEGQVPFPVVGKLKRTTGAFSQSKRWVIEIERTKGYTQKTMRETYTGTLVDRYGCIFRVGWVGASFKKFGRPHLYLYLEPPSHTLQPQSPSSG